MRNLIFVSHCTPYPPDKGEKIRAFNILRHLAPHYRIHLGCLMDGPDDPARLDVLRQWCTEVAGFPIDRRRQKVTALLRARPGRPLMLDYYRQSGLQHWVQDTLSRTAFDVLYVYSVAMMPYFTEARRPGQSMILDAMDIDSEKWSSYAADASYPMRLVWSREGRTLLAYERRAAMAADATLFVSPQETERFAALAPETASRIHSVENGVDLNRFSPGQVWPTPFDSDGPHLVFTGNMDYWPNAEAVAWFAEQVMPTLRAVRPGVQFTIVGANPGPDTLRLAALPGVRVTGRVPDVHPYVAHADVCVAPLRIARGIQNKVLEAMAMGRPVVASPQAFEGVHATPGQDLLVVDGPAATAQAILEILDGLHPSLPAAARLAVERRYAWSATLSRLDAILDTSATQPVIEPIV